MAKRRVVPAQPDAVQSRPVNAIRARLEALRIDEVMGILSRAAPYTMRQTEIEGRCNRQYTVPSVQTVLTKLRAENKVSGSPTKGWKLKE